MPQTPDSLSRHVLADPLCRRLAELAATHGMPMALVGGVVRDWLLGRPALDWDLMVAGEPVALTGAIGRLVRGPVIPLDPVFGVYRARVADGLTLDFTRMQGDSIEADLRRRDLTINALAVGLADGELRDPTGGLADLAARRVRAVSRQNLLDDPLRLLRVFRFAATLDFGIAPETLGWVAELAPEIGRSAGERIWAELAKLLASPRPARELEAMVACGLFAAVFPELAAREPAALAAVRRLADRLAAAGRPATERAAAWLTQPLTADRPALAILMMAALAQAAPEPLEALASFGARLHWSKREHAWAQAALATREAAAALASMHDEADLTLALHRITRVARDAAPGALLLSTLDQPEPWLAKAWERLDHPLPRLVDGHMLMHALARAPGPWVATLLVELEEAQVLGRVATREEALAWAARVTGDRE